MPYFNSGNIKIFYENYGQGDPVILLHGFSIDHRMWEYQKDRLAGFYRVITPDARGHGKSDAPRTGYAREDRVIDLLNLIDYLGLEKIHLVGMSMGGGDALAYAIDYQEKLISLTLIGTVASGWKPSKKFHDFAPLAQDSGIEKARKAYVKSSLSYYRDRKPAVREKLEAMMNSFSGAPWLDPMKGKYLKRDDLKLAGKVSAPTLLMVGKRDIFFTPLANRLRDLIPDSELVIIPGAGHVVNMEAPDLFNERLLRFLKRVS